MSISAVDERALLRDLLRARSVRTGQFKLASGAMSSYYVDARLTTMSGSGQVLIGRRALAEIDARGWTPEFVGGLTLGADPVAYAIAHAAAAADRAIDAFTVRKQAKEHGTGKLIEGNLRPGSHALIVEDVITSGESALRAIHAAQEFGALIVGVLCVVDRQEGGRARIEDEGFEVAALFTAQELLEGE